MNPNDPIPSDPPTWLKNVVFAHEYLWKNRTCKQRRYILIFAVIIVIIFLIFGFAKYSGYLTTLSQTISHMIDCLNHDVMKRPLTCSN